MNLNRKFLDFLTCCFLLLASVASTLSAESSAKQDVTSLAAVLNSNAGLKEKADACRELARRGNKEAVAALVALLPDEQLSHMARYSLETMPDRSVDRVLREALSTLHGRQLVGVIGSLGVRRDSK